VISYAQALLLGLFQGVTELFPISSLGHSIVLPRLVGWDTQQGDPFFLSFLVATHVATSIVLVGFFWRDWVNIFRGLWRTVQEKKIHRDNSHGRVGWLLIVGTIPAGILGLLFQDPLGELFASPRIVAVFMALNGLMLYIAERLRRRAPHMDTTVGSDKRIASIKWRHALAVGTAQAIALFPGFSRSGSTMGGGLLIGLSNEDAARYSFLLGTPIIAAAAVLKLPVLFEPQNQAVMGPAIAGAVCSGITAFFSVKFLLKYFETNRLTPFAIYCATLGITLSLIFAFQ
jgi:undecaprenyl-diphosphatase